MRRHLLFVWLFGLSCVCAGAESAPRWLQVHTDHFTVITDASERQGRHVAGQLERMQAVFSRLIPNAHADTGAPIVVLALKDRKDFQALQPASYLGKNQMQLSGLFIRAPDKSYILLRLDDTGNEHAFSTVYHEYTHYILRHATFIPLWLNEGLAEFYQNTDIDEREVRFGQPSVDDILFLRQQKLLPLPTLLAVDQSSPYYHDEQKGSIFYSEAWALTHFIIINDRANHTDRLTDYMRLVAASHDPVKAAVQAFGDLKKLQQALENYVENGDYRLFRMPTGVTVDESSFRVDPLATPDADAIRADVLVADDRTQDAQALVDSVLRSNPNNALVHESEAMLRFREHDMAGAKKWYGEAVALHSTSYLAYYYFAMLSLQDGTGSQAEIEDSLQQSLKLNPTFAPANDALARFYGMHHENLDEALRLSVTAVELEPDNLNYRLGNAQLHVERMELPSALNVLEAAKPYAKTTGELVAIDMRESEIENYQVATEHRKTYPQPERTTPADGASVSTVVTANSAGADKIVSIVPVTPAAHEPPYPEGPPVGPRHTVRGTLRNVRCSYPSILTLTVDGSGKTIALYTNNMYKVAYSTANFTPAKDLQPCQEFEGMKAAVTYTEVSDKRVVGQIVAIEVSK
jgi:tetratricopeptide (TPR) repeat protein